MAARTGGGLSLDGLEGARGGGEGRFHLCRPPRQSRGRLIHQSRHVGLHACAMWAQRRELGADLQTRWADDGKCPGKSGEGAGMARHVARAHVYVVRGGRVGEGARRVPRCKPW